MRKISLGILSALLFLASCKKADRVIAEVTDDTTTVPENGRKCASQEVLEEQIQANPQRAIFLEDLERKTEAFKGRDQSLYRTSGILYIPVVVNVVLPNAGQVSDAQIQSQLDALNNDYNHANSELNNTSVYLAGYPFSNVANCQIQFYISSTADIVRRNNTATPTFGTNDAVKKTAQGGLDPKDASTKLNFWVCDLSSGLLGYAQFPGGSVATDGVVIDYQGFGTAASYALYAAFDKGRTATHEIGHWLNLRHIWGDRRCGTDYVGDTPDHDDANYGCPSTSHKSRCAGKPFEQWMNYMDYTDDACMYMFSGGQKARMDAAIDAARASYVSPVKL